MIFKRRKDDEKLPQSLEIHEEYIQDFIFKAIDSGIELKKLKEQIGLYLKACTDILTKEDMKKVIDRHFKLMNEDSRLNED